MCERKRAFIAFARRAHLSCLLHEELIEVFHVGIVILGHISSEGEQMPALLLHPGPLGPHQIHFDRRASDRAEAAEVVFVLFGEGLSVLFIEGFEDPDYVAERVLSKHPTTRKRWMRIRFGPQ